MASEFKHVCNSCGQSYIGSINTINCKKYTGHSFCKQCSFKNNYSLLSRKHICDSSCENLLFKK